MSYRVGWPLWKLFARLGVRLSYRYVVYYDPEARRFTSVSPDIQGLVVEADSLPELKDDTKDIARILVADMLFPDQTKSGREPAVALKGEGLLA